MRLLLESVSAKMPFADLAVSVKSSLLLTKLVKIKAVNVANAVNVAKAIYNAVKTYGASETGAEFKGTPLKPAVLRWPADKWIIAGSGSTTPRAFVYMLPEAANLEQSTLVHFNGFQYGLSSIEFSSSGKGRVRRSTEPEPVLLSEIDLDLNVYFAALAVATWLDKKYNYLHTQDSIGHGHTKLLPPPPKETFAQENIRLLNERQERNEARDRAEEEQEIAALQQDRQQDKAYSLALQRQGSAVSNHRRAFPSKFESETESKPESESKWKWWLQTLGLNGKLGDSDSDEDDPPILTILEIARKNCSDKQFWDKVMHPFMSDLNLRQAF